VMGVAIRLLEGVEPCLVTTLLPRAIEASPVAVGRAWSRALAITSSSAVLWSRAAFADDQRIALLRAEATGLTELGMDPGGRRACPGVAVDALDIAVAATVGCWIMKQQVLQKQRGNTG
jgi:hypothetical protein